MKTLVSKVNDEMTTKLQMPVAATKRWKFTGGRREGKIELVILDMIMPGMSR